MTEWGIKQTNNLEGSLVWLIFVNIMILEEEVSMESKNHVMYRHRRREKDKLE